MVSSEAEKQRVKNRQMLLKSLTNICFLARQGLPLCGSWNKEYNIDIDSSFHQLILLRCENQRVLQSWLDQSTDKYTSPQMQNEMVQVSALGILTELSSCILVFSAQNFAPLWQTNLRIFPMRNKL